MIILDSQWKGIKIDEIKNSENDGFQKFLALSEFSYIRIICSSEEIFVTSPRRYTNFCDWRTNCLKLILKWENKRILEKQEQFRWDITLFFTKLTNRQDPEKLLKFLHEK